MLTSLTSNGMKNVLLWGGIGIAITVGILVVVTFANPTQVQESSSREDLGPNYSQSVPFEGAQHVAEGTEVSYRSNPPTSGSHWPDPLRDGIYEEEKPDQAIIHSMEHGRVWVSYKPEIGEEAIQFLKDLLRREVRVILTPRAGNETDIVLAAWTRLDAFDLAQDGEQLALSEVEGRVRDFIERYRDQGPEYIPQMTGKTYD